CLLAVLGREYFFDRDTGCNDSLFSLQRMDVMPPNSAGEASRRTREAPAHTIHAMHEHERPRERFAHLGAGVLSDAELLPILLRTGYKGVNVIELSAELLEQCGRLPGLARVPFAELAAVKGIGSAKAAELHACFELGRRVAQASPEDRPQIKSP